MVITEIKTVVEKGAMVKVTKVALLQNQSSDVSIGGVFYGKISNDAGLRKGHSLRFAEGGNTSTVQEITETKGGDFIFKTNTSVYLLQKI